MPNGGLPSTRSNGLIVREVGDELLIYDTASDRATALNPLAARVWRACDGRSSVAEIVARVRQEDAQLSGCSEFEARTAVLSALDKLDDSALVLGFEQTDQGRRDIVRWIGTGALALAAVTTIVSPTPAQAASCLPVESPCTNDTDCCSGLCHNGGCVNP